MQALVTRVRRIFQRDDAWGLIVSAAVLVAFVIAAYAVVELAHRGLS